MCLTFYGLTCRFWKGDFIMSASNSEQIGCMLLYVFAQIEESEWDPHSFVYKAQKLRAERNIRMDSILCVSMVWWLLSLSVIARAHSLIHLTHRISSLVWARWALKWFQCAQNEWLHVINLNIFFLFFPYSLVFSLFLILSLFCIRASEIRLVFIFLIRPMLFTSNAM